MNREIFHIFEIYSIQVDYISLVSFLLIPIFFILAFFIFFKFLKKIDIFHLKKKETQVKINLKNPKETAYTITFLIHKVETPYNEQLLKKLEEYKYKKTVNQLDKETVDLIRKFLEYIKTAKVKNGSAF